MYFQLHMYVHIHCLFKCAICTCNVHVDKKPMTLTKGLSLESVPDG